MHENIDKHLNGRSDFALYENLKNTVAISDNLQWKELYERITAPIVSKNKDIPLLGPYKIEDGQRRSNQNVEKVSALCFDIDNSKGRSFEEIVRLVEQYAGVIHTTHSHTKDNPRFRIIFALCEQITVEKYSEVRNAFLFYNQELSSIIDVSCSDPSRAYYLFSYPPERNDLAQCFVLLGEPINPSRFYIPIESNIPKLKSAQLMNKVDDSPTTEGGRNNRLARYVGGLIAKGFEQNETLNQAIELNMTFIPPLDLDEVNEVNRKIWKTHANKLKPFDIRVDDPIKSSYKLVSAANFLNLIPPQREWCIKEFLPKKIVATMIAAGGTGKSILALHIAVAIASGTSLFAKYFPDKPAKVVFISGEDDLAELHRRLHKVTQGLGDSVKELVSNNLHFIDLADSFDLFTSKSAHQDAKITSVPSRICSAIINSIGDDVGLVIIDPISRFRGGEENLAADTTRFVQALQQIRDQLNTTVLTLHHVNKGARMNGATQNNARGSSAFIDGVRLVFELNSLSPEDLKRKYGSAFSESRMLLLQTVKSNYGKPIDPLYLLRCDDGSLELQSMLPTDHQNKAILQEIKMSKLSKNQFKETYGDAKGKFGLSEKALVRKLEELKENEFLIIGERKPMTLTASGEELLNK
jgi:RecA-family ATPase